MEFLEGQFYTAKNLLSYRTRVESSELNNLLCYVKKGSTPKVVEKVQKV